MSDSPEPLPDDRALVVAGQRLPVRPEDLSAMSEDTARELIEAINLAVVERQQTNRINKRFAVFYGVVTALSLSVIGYSAWQISQSVNRMIVSIDQMTEDFTRATDEITDQLQALDETLERQNRELIEALQGLSAMVDGFENLSDGFSMEPAPRQNQGANHPRPF